MTDINQFHDSLNIGPPPSKKIPDMLNVLSILSLIWCGLSLLSAFYSYFTICKSVQMMEKLSDTDNPMAGMMSSISEAAVKQCDMKLPVLIITLISLVICFIGVLQMRKLKKPGFFLYLIGEIAAPIAMIVLIGNSMMRGFALLGLIFPIVFIVLYATQLKHMK